MAQVSRGEVQQSVIDELGLQPGSGNVSLNCKEDIQPVIIPRKNVFIKSRDSAGTIYTTPSRGNFFLTSLCLGCRTAAGDLSTYVYLYVIQDGVSRAFMLPINTGVAESKIMTISFNIPIKADRATNITIGGNNTITLVTGTIIGFVEN